MEHRAFTRRASGILNKIETPAGVFPVASGQFVVPKKIEQFTAIWDTGATHTAVASSVVAKLGIKLITFRPVNTGGGQVNAPVYLVNIALPNNVIVQGIQVTELKELRGCDVLIGMDIITGGDFALTHVSGKTCFSFSVPSSRELDFVPDSDTHNKRLLLGRRAFRKDRKGRRRRKK